MYQSKLEQYFQFLAPPRSRGRTFFDLPYDIRCRIYRLVGVVRKCPIYLSRDSSERRIDFDCYGYPTDCVAAQASDLDCDCDDYHCRGYYRPIPISLFCCTRDVSREVSSLFYGENRFYVQYTSLGSFDAIMRLRPTTLATIRYLHIVLHQISRDMADRSCEFHFLVSHIGRVSPLQRIPPRHYRDLVSGWKAVCERLAKSIVQSQLEMCLICDTEDKTIAAEVLNPLHQLPYLAAFSVRLSPPLRTRCIAQDKSPYADLRCMARETSLQITGRANNTCRQTLWHSLPFELILRILEHTDLIGPECQLAWAPSQGFSHISEYYDHRQYQPPPCRICNSVRIACHPPLLPKGGTWVSQCNKCWQFPLSLFLVSRQFHQAATRIFWSRNRFIVISQHVFSYVPVTGPFPPTLEPFQFTDFLSPSAFHYLRHLHFKPPGLWGKELARFKESIETLRRGADLPRLTITLDFRTSDPTEGYRYDLIPPFPEDENDRRCLRFYEPTVTALTVLRGLKDLFVYVDKLWGWGDRGKYERAVFEQKLERMVMGEEYESPKEIKRHVHMQWDKIWLL
ncbi:hypothetical protein BDV26DRAFT_268222 [Aspergillus bertholletiae]|uniref:F-box domain-containing protein n=1 Tax=Aspergillus bertholletiae TaxID=1226010 RepID=A0A5N7B2C2_9EURO|nr:hypothetical protein BDV26DRAFT_268222 [Aspergillus bertholletiae]